MSYKLLSLFLGFIDLSHRKVTGDHYHHSSPLPTLDGSISLETTYVIPTTDPSSSSVGTDYDSLTNKKVRFIVQKQPISSAANSNFTISTTKTNDMTQRRKISFVDAVNNKHLDLSTGIFSSSSPSPFVLSSSSFSSSLASPDQHRHSNPHFSSSSSPSSPLHTSITITDNKNLPASSLSVNNHHSLIGTDSLANTENTATTITLKEAIDANILDAHSAYVVDTLEQR
jgi:hypothetical protein